MTPPEMPTTPRLLTEETCEPARLTRAEVISRPEVRCGFFDRAGDGLRGRGQIDDGPFADALGRFDAHAQDAHGAFSFHPGDQGADLGCADINSDYNWIIHALLLHPIERCVHVFHTDHCRLNAIFVKTFHYGGIDIDLG